MRQLGAPDLADTGRLLFEAFARVTRAHGFTPPFANAEEGERLARAYLHLDPEGAVVATDAGAVVGCGFIHLRGRVASIGPVAAAPRAMAGVGRAVMQRLLAIAHDVPSVRLFQDAFNARSFALYTRLGFRIHETVAVVAAAAPRLPASRSRVHIRAMEDSDLAEVSSALEAKLGEAEHVKLVWRPQTTTEVELEAAQSLMRLIEALEEDDDVQSVTANVEISDEVMAQL